MALYHKATTTWSIAESDSLAQTLANRSTSKIEATDITELIERRIAIPNGTSDLAIGFTGSDGMTTIKALQIITDQPISVKINGGDTGIPIGHTAGESATLLLDATAITALSVSNASGATANVYFSMPGA